MKYGLLCFIPSKWELLKFPALLISFFSVILFRAVPIYTLIFASLSATIRPLSKNASSAERDLVDVDMISIPWLFNRLIVWMSLFFVFGSSRKVARTQLKFKSWLMMLWLDKRWASSSGNFTCSYSIEWKCAGQPQDWQNVGNSLLKFVSDENK